ncbi:MAG: hypothetical protein RLZ33_2105, partial [Bacteroidota bacterium]
MMKALITYLILIFHISLGFSQTWQSINKVQFSNTVPWGQFTINQYTNDIWLVNDNKVALIQNSGNIQMFDYLDLGTLWTGDDLMFAFTPDSLFYMIKTVGLLNFNSFSSSQIFSETNISTITSNADTVYISRMGTLLKYVDGNVTDTYYSASDILAKNSYLYSNNGVLGHNVAYSNVMLWTDSQYLMAPLNTMRFQRFTDSIYVGTTKGLMFAFNYDVLDTITPNNTTNMPSPNVLEIEFDHFDSLWAVFGDVNDVPFAIAKLEGSTWTNVFDASNSPIDFSNFLGLEIDTLGNLWVADNMALHTLLTPNSPSWLGLNDNELVQNLNVYPNPATDQLTISSSTVNKNNYILFDPQGRKVLEGSLTGTTTQLDLSKLARGNYLLQIGEKKT